MSGFLKLVNSKILNTISGKKIIQTSKNFVTDFGAFTDGITDSSPAVDKWLSYASAHDGSTLFMPAHDYILNGTNSLTAGVNNATISGYGASVNNLFIGNPGVIQSDYSHSARIQTVAATSTSVTLVNSADASIFSIGQWILIAGLSMQLGSYPPNFHYNEYRKITGITGSVISFSGGLTFTYLSTWPTIDLAKTQAMDLGGPATIYALLNVFEGTHTYLGLRNKSAAATFGGGSQNVILTDMTFDGLGPAPSMSKNYTINTTAIGSQNEVDKAVENLTYNNCTGNQILVQSAAVNNLTVHNGTSITTLNGTATNTVIDNSTISLVVAGPLAFGHGVTITATNSVLTTAIQADMLLEPNLLTFNNGTFSQNNANAGASNGLWERAVPGQKYFFAYYDGTIHKNPDGGGPVVSFTITALRQDATNTYADTDIGPVLPTPTYLGGTPYNQFIAYAAATITQIASGPADLTQFAAP